MHMAELIPVLCGLAITDSMNPSVIAVTLGIVLSGAEKKNRLALAYILSVFITYLMIGILLTIGLQIFFHQISEFTNSKEANYIQAAIGAIMFIWSWIPPKEKKQSEYPFLANGGMLKMVLLGITVTIVELITAVPYLGAIVLLQQANIFFGVKIALLIPYNVIMILPPLMILFGYNLNKNRFELWLAKRKERKKKTSEALQWIVGIIGFFLLADAVNFLMY